MKKIFSLLLVIMLLVSTIPTVHSLWMCEYDCGAGATYIHCDVCGYNVKCSNCEHCSRCADDNNCFCNTCSSTNYANGTQVSFNAEADNDGDGQPDNVESYTVTVPAKLAPAGSGNVVAQGTWASTRKLIVTADPDVTLTNSINTADEKVLTVTFPGIELVGSNTAAVSDTKVVSVADIEAALFGTWTGIIEYNVEMVDVVKMIAFQLRHSYDQIENLQVEEGTTWGEFIEANGGPGNCYTLDITGNGEIYSPPMAWLYRPSGEVCHVDDVIESGFYECIQ